MTEYALNTTLGIAFGFALGSVVGAVASVLWLAWLFS
jgi:hypothetical protein